MVMMIRQWLWGGLYMLLRWGVCEMDAVCHIKNQLLIRNGLLAICIGALVFIGGAFLWQGFLVKAYVVWKPVIDFLRMVPVGWWLLIVALLLIAKGLRDKFRESCTYSSDYGGAVFSVSDAPIRIVTEDEFARGAYARTLSTLIMSSSNTRDARYIGIYGQWGYGKSSARNLIEECIRKDYGEGNSIFAMGGGVYAPVVVSQICYNMGRDG